MSGLISKPLGIITAVGASIVSGYVGLCIVAYVFAGGMENPAAGRAAMQTVTDTATSVLPAIGRGLIDLFQAIGRAVMDAIQS